MSGVAPLRRRGVLHSSARIGQGADGFRLRDDRRRIWALDPLTAHRRPFGRRVRRDPRRHLNPHSHTTREPRSAPRHLRRSRSRPVRRRTSTFPRCVSYRHRHTCRRDSGTTTRPHRDTWYSAPQCQNNWWTPIAGNSAVTGMQFHPDYWQRAVPNTSEGFDAYEWNKTSRRDAAVYVKNDPRPHPTLAGGDPGTTLRVVGDPGSSSRSLARNCIRRFPTNPTLHG